jgi:gliding motility-associated-like protein
MAPWGLTFSPDGSRLYVANSLLNAVQVINTTTYSIMATIPVGAIPMGTSVTPDGSRLYVANYTDGTVSVINTTTDKVIATVTVGPNPFSIGNFVSPGTGCTGKPVKFTITVNPDPVLVPTIAAGPASGNISACFGTASVAPNIQQITVDAAKLTGPITVTAPINFEVSLSAASGFGGSVTISPTAGTVNGITVYVRSTATAPAGSIQGKVALTSQGATEQDVDVTGNISAPVSPSVSIASSANSICAGTPVTFTAIPVNGGAAPVYQWQVNGNNTGTNSAAFTSGTLANGDVVDCVMTSNAACAAPANITSNSIAMIVNPLLSPSVSITASAAAVCTGTQVTFTATPVNGGAAPVYQWQVNGSSAGTNNAEFTSSSLADGDVITCIMTSDVACGVPAPATSNSLAETVYPLPTVAAGGNKTINEGSSTVLNATDTGDIADITWSPPTGLSSSKVLNPVASPATTTTFTITVTTTTGCTATDSATIKVVIPPIVIPNTFTPNGDGINDTWDIKYLSYYPNCSVQVFTRWGQNIYTSTGYPTPWNGDYHNIPLPIGTYYYIINLENNSLLLSGFVMIIR